MHHSFNCATYVVHYSTDLIQGRASHASALLGDYMWVFGGYSLSSEPFDNLVRYMYIQGFCVINPNNTYMTIKELFLFKIELFINV